MGLENTSKEKSSGIRCQAGCLKSEVKGIVKCTTYKTPSLLCTSSGLCLDHHYHCAAAKKLIVRNKITE